MKKFVFIVALFAVAIQGFSQNVEGFLINTQITKPPLNNDPFYLNFYQILLFEKFSGKLMFTSFTNLPF